jgi:hypothetical protein
VRPLLRGEQRLELALPAPRRDKKRRMAESATQAVDGAVDGAVDAPPAGPAEGVAARQPANLDALAQVSGIDATKLEHYGDALLAVITTSCREETCHTS